MGAHAYDIGSNVFIVSTLILIFTYGLVIVEWVNRAVLALLGAGFMVAFGIIIQEQAYAGIDWNTIFRLAGMMMIVAISRRCGIFQYVAIRAAKIARGLPGVILALLTLVTAIFSGFLDNVTTVLLVVPVTLVICSELKVPVYPFLLTEILASNIGGTATLIGDPPNILIGSAVGLTFNDFILTLGPVIAFVLAVQIALNHLIWGHRMKAAVADRERILGMNEREAITDRALMFKSLLVLASVILAFVLARAIHLEPGTIAMFGAALLLLLDNVGRHSEHQTKEVSKVFEEIEWVTLFFFIGLFIVVAGVAHAGLLQFLADQVIAFTGGDRQLATFSILWSSAVLSAIVDNIPFVATMIPLVKSMAPALGGPDAIRPLWWALSLGACLGGNGTLIGASANLMVANMAERNGVPFRFVTFMAVAFPMMALSIAISHLYLLWRFF